MIYFVALLLFIAQAYVYDFQNTKILRNSNIVVATIILIVIASARYRVGLDTLRYMDYFDSVNISQYSEIYDYILLGVDPLFFLIIALIKINNGDFVWLQVIHAVIFNAAFIFFIVKKTRYVFTAITIYFVLFYFRYNFEILRESLAVAMFLFSYKYLVNKDYIKFYAIAIIAMLFHPSAFFLLLMPFIPNIKSNHRAMLIAVIAIPAGYYLQSNFEDVFNILSLDVRVGQKIQRYADTEFSGVNISVIGALQKMALYVFLPHMLIRFINSTTRQNMEYEKFIVINYVIVIISLQVGIFSRFSNYLIPFYILLIAEFLGLSKKIKLTFGISRIGSPFAIVTVVFIIFMNYYSLIKERDGISDIYRFFPYYTIFENITSPEREGLFNYYN